MDQELKEPLESGSSSSNNNNNNNTNNTNNSTSNTNGNNPSSVEESLRLIDDLKFFLATAPANWQENQIIRRYYLNHDEGFVSCVFWNNLYFVTGTDIVKCLIYRFEKFGRTVTDRKKFEEGVFSDLRNLKCGTDAILEPPKSRFLEFLYKNSCLRTQKKQKVFFWFSVQHDKLFADALERDLKREMVDQKTTTKADREPALSFQYDDSKSLFEQLQSHIDAKKKDLGISTENPVQAQPQAPVGAAAPNAASENPYSYLQMANQVPQHGMAEDSQLAAAQQFMDFAETENEMAPGAGDDDFPLDFFPHNDYIDETVDPAQTFMSNTVPSLDPNIFLYPHMTAGGGGGGGGVGGVGGVPNFDDFLIDQATPFTPAVAEAQLDDKKYKGEKEVKVKEEDDADADEKPQVRPNAAPGMLNPAVLQNEMLTNPYFAAAAAAAAANNPMAAAMAADPSAMYFDPMMALQAQHQMIGLMNSSMMYPGMMNPQFMGPERLSNPSFQSVPVNPMMNGALNQLQRQKMAESGGMRMNRVPMRNGVGAGSASSAGGGRVTKPGKEIKKEE